MRTYDQYCPAALALDLVGDRWTLLIVRELGVRPGRYGDLHRALPGIATNLLAERLRTLADAGVIRSDVTPDRTTYSLTEWGAELYDIVTRLGRWGARLLYSGRGDRLFHASYVMPILHAAYEVDGVDLGGLEPVSVRVDVDGESVRIEIGDGRLDVVADASRAAADVVLDGAAESIVAILAGAAEPSGPGVTGSRTALRRLRAFTARSSVRAVRNLPPVSASAGR